MLSQKKRGLKQVIDISSGWKEVWGALEKGLLKIPSTPYLCDHEPISVLIFKRQRSAFCCRGEKLLCALSSAIYTSAVPETFYPKLSLSSQNCTTATPGENPAQDKSAAKMWSGSTRKHHNKCPKTQEGAHKLQEGSRNINRATSPVQRGWDPMEPWPAATLCLLQWG